jgi:hypothetical protein
VRSHGWLPAGQANFIKAQRGEQLHQLKNLIILHKLRIWPEGHIFWHAVYTAKIAVIRQTDA